MTVLLFLICCVSTDELEDDGQPALVSILFVDYGYTEQLRTASLHPMPKRFLALPKQGVKCSLAFVGKGPDIYKTIFK